MRLKTVSSNLECGREAKFNNTKADDVKYSQ